MSALGEGSGDTSVNAKVPGGPGHTPEQTDWMLVRVGRELHKSHVSICHPGACLKQACYRGLLDSHGGGVTAQPPAQGGCDGQERQAMHSVWSLMAFSTYLYKLVNVGSVTPSCQGRPRDTQKHAQSMTPQGAGVSSHCLHR